jgi:tRNA (cmo5U34)-methyltransferase
MSDDVSKNFDSGAWAFTPEVVEAFDGHVSVHVPNYQLIQELVVHLSDWFAPAHGIVADVGAATGTTVKMIADRHPQRHLDFFLYDVEQPMLDAAQLKFQGMETTHSFYGSTNDLVFENAEHSSADLTLCLFTLQFVPTHQRVRLLRAMREASRPETGVLIVAEKIELDTGIWQEIANEATWDHKAQHGVDAEDIRLKARALRGVLRPGTAGDLKRQLEIAGWGTPLEAYRWYNWGVWVVRNDLVP